MRLFSTLFDRQVDAAPENYQRKLIELQCSNEIKSKFHCEHVLLLDFYKKYLESKRYPYLVKHAKKMASIFGGTYACEQIFLTMKLTKTKLRAQPTDEHWQDFVLLSSSTYHLNFKNFQIRHNIKYHINVYRPVSTNVCCVLCCRYELLKSAVILIKIS